MASKRRARAKGKRLHTEPAAEPLSTVLARLPRRVAFVAVALVQIGVELAVKAVQGALASRGDGAS